MGNELSSVSGTLCVVVELSTCALERDNKIVKREGKKRKYSDKIVLLAQS